LIIDEFIKRLDRNLKYEKYEVAEDTFQN